MEPLANQGMLPPPLESEFEPGGLAKYAASDPKNDPLIELGVYDRYFVELINRARLDPEAEAHRLGIDLNAGLPEGTITADGKQPLAVDPRLGAAAINHSQFVLASDDFSHSGENGSLPKDRIIASGYPSPPGSAVGENLAMTGTTLPLTLDRQVIDELHRNLFESPLHRENLFVETFREIGSGTTTGVFTKDGTDFNSAVTTHDFAFSSERPGPFLTGVAYSDLDNDGTYSPGEGQLFNYFIYDPGFDTALPDGSRVARGGYTIVGFSDFAGGYDAQLLFPGTVKLNFNSGGGPLVIPGDPDVAPPETIPNDAAVKVDVPEGSVVKVDLVDGHTIKSSGTVTLLGGAENVHLLGIEPIDGRGNGAANTLMGNSAANQLFGEAGNDLLIGGPGADTLDGGAEFDTADYFDSPERVVLLLANADQWGVGGAPGTTNQAVRLSGGDAEGDTLRNIEKVATSQFDDLVFGFDTGTWADLWNGDDTFDNNEEADAEDRIFGGHGNDRIWTGAANDELYGEWDDDWLIGEAGADRIVGGDGRDGVIYTGSPEGVTVILSPTDEWGVGNFGWTKQPEPGGYYGTPSGSSGGHAAGDTFPAEDIENVVGSWFDDYIFGSNSGGVAELKQGDDWFDNAEAVAASDRVDGGEGADHIWTGAGNDIVNGGPENDDLWGEGGRDIFVFEDDFDFDTVHDFTLDLDQLLIVGFDRSHLTLLPGTGSDTVIRVVSTETYKDNEQITLKNFVAPQGFLEQIALADEPPDQPLI